MVIIKEINKIRKIIKEQRKKQKKIGFVPTMGALHEGHLSLIRKARQENDYVVVSIFVNPAQFAPKEDLKRYPRPIKKDLLLCRKQGVDFVFYPSAKEMYPENFGTYVEVKGLNNLLCGRSRPGHFRGVATVIAKLFNIVQPDIAYFGQKDAQQTIIIKRMVCDLNMPVKIKVMPTVRERNGLALSSRNLYLNQEERKDALVLRESLELAKKLIRMGERDAGRIISLTRQLISKNKTAKVDYIAIVDNQSLKPVKRITKDCLIALAVRIGRTRLIDNICLN